MMPKMRRLIFLISTEYRMDKTPKTTKEFFHNEIINWNSFYMPIPRKKKHEEPEKANRKNVDFVIAIHKRPYLWHLKPPLKISYSVMSLCYWSVSAWTFSSGRHRLSSHSQETKRLKESISPILLDPWDFSR